MNQGFTISALGPTLSAQCAERGYVAKGFSKIETVDELAKAITMLYVHGLLGTAERDRACRRLLKTARLTQVITYQEL